MIRRLLIALACAFALAPAAQAFGDPRLDALASKFAMRPVTIECLTEEEDSTLSYAWGYTYLYWDKAVVDAALCNAALAIADGAPEREPDWRMAVAVLVLVHESYHMRHWDLRHSEAAVECRAIRHTRVAMRLLGADERLADRLMPWALATHWRIGAVAPEYNSKTCKVPWPW